MSGATRAEVIPCEEAYTTRRTSRSAWWKCEQAEHIGTLFGRAEEARTRTRTLKMGLKSSTKQAGMQERGLTGPADSGKLRQVRVAAAIICSSRGFKGSQLWSTPRI